MKTVILEACADVVMATTSYAHLQQEIVLSPINNLKETVNFVIFTFIPNMFATFTATATSWVVSGLRITFGKRLRHAPL